MKKAMIAGAVLAVAAAAAHRAGPRMMERAMKHCMGMMSARSVAPACDASVQCAT